MWLIDSHCFPENIAIHCRQANRRLFRRVKSSINLGGFPHSKEDQLDTIFSTIGTPQEADLGFVTDAKAKDYLKSFQHQEKANLATKFPKVPKEAIDLLEKTIVFDPRKRLSV